MKKSEVKYMDPDTLRSRAQALLKKDPFALTTNDNPVELQAVIQELQIHQIELELQNEELRLTQTELKESRDSFADLYDFAPIGYLTVGRNGAIRHINLTGTKLLRTDRQKIINSRLQLFFEYDSLFGYNQFIEKAFDTNVQVAFETQLVIKNNPGPYVRLEGFVSEGTQEFRIAMIDITEQIKAKEILEHNLNLSSALAKLYAPIIMPDATVSTSAHVVLEEVIKLTGSQYGCIGTFDANGSLDHISTNTMNDCRVVSMDESPMFRVNSAGEFASLQGYSLNTRKPFFTNDVAKHHASTGIPDGHVKLNNLLSIPVLLGDNLFGQVMLANKSSDYTENDIENLKPFTNIFALAIQRLKNKHDLTAVKELLHRILLGIKAGIIVVDRETQKIETINNIALDMLQGAEENYVGMNIDVLNCINSSGKKVPFCTANIERNGGTDLRISKYDGQMVPIQRIVLEDVIDGKNKFLGIIFDITGRKKLERRLALSQKMESIGQLSAGIAHEINTPSQYIGGNLKFMSGAFDEISSFLNKYRNDFDSLCKTGQKELQTQWDKQDIDYFLTELPNSILQSIEGVDQISSIVSALKRFSHPGSDSKVSSDINDALKTTSIICRNEWKYHADVVFDFKDEEFSIPCYINELNQVFVNIVINAAHALKQKYEHSDTKGTITIQTRDVDKWFEIIIHDTGAGIPAEALPRVFDPFFTTKEMGVGSGQGLALAYSIITEKHGGTIEFKSEEGVGTTCLIRLPIQ
ncbi:GAF domain-containing protein [Maridesulfovibrio ferrireducens]|uniref:histidine kinase n=1 Tax=Maridesulfovibrio ferrireducens TaxID=246191 RepID=A0A1G9ASF2_9BACT|nr:ATP-binding protein [Maridesulfovibrio ferrireducens]SDK30173.1 GAF domain-containing protein [Maridesulfovibrio ferrireducens]